MLPIPLSRCPNHIWTIIYTPQTNFYLCKFYCPRHNHATRTQFHGRLPADHVGEYCSLRAASDAIVEHFAITGVPASNQMLRLPKDRLPAAADHWKHIGHWPLQPYAEIQGSQSPPSLAHTTAVLYPVPRTVCCSKLNPPCPLTPAHKHVPDNYTDMSVMPKYGIATAAYCTKRAQTACWRGRGRSSQTASTHWRQQRRSPRIST